MPKPHQSCLAHPEAGTSCCKSLPVAGEHLSCRHMKPWKMAFCACEQAAHHDARMCSGNRLQLHQTPHLKKSWIQHQTLPRKERMEGHYLSLPGWGIQCFLLLPQPDRSSHPNTSCRLLMPCPETRGLHMAATADPASPPPQGDDFGLTSRLCLCLLQAPQGQEEHPWVWAGAPVSVPCPNFSVHSPDNFHPFRPIYGKHKRSLSLPEAPGHGAVTGGSQFPSSVTCPAGQCFPSFPLRNFSQHGSVFLSAEAQSKGDQTSGTHAPRNPSASKPGCGAGCIPGTGNQKAEADTQHSAEVRGPFAVGKMGQEETAITRSLKSLVYASPVCRASFPAERSVSLLAIPASVPVAGSTRDGELQGDRGAKRSRRQRHQQPSGAARAGNRQ